MSESRCSFVVAKAVGNTEADAGLGSCLLNTRAWNEPALQFSHSWRRPLLRHTVLFVWERASRCFQSKEGPSSDLIRDCERFVYTFNKHAVAFPPPRIPRSCSPVIYSHQGSCRHTGATLTFCLKYQLSVNLFLWFINFIGLDLALFTRSIHIEPWIIIRENNLWQAIFLVESLRLLCHHFSSLHGNTDDERCFRHQQYFRFLPTWHMY